MPLDIFPAASAGFDFTKVTLQQTITSGTSVTIPAGVTWVYAILIGGGGSGGNRRSVCTAAGGGGAGG